MALRDLHALSTIAVDMRSNLHQDNYRAGVMVPSRVQCSLLMSLHARPITQCPIKHQRDESLDVCSRLRSATYHPNVACFSKPPTSLYRQQYGYLAERESRKWKLWRCMWLPPIHPNTPLLIG